MNDTACQAMGWQEHDSARSSNQTRSGNALRILMPSYRSAPYSGGQGVYVKHLSKALTALGHHVDVISGPPYPHLDPSVGLIKLPSLDLHAQPNGLLALRFKHLLSYTDTYEWFAHNTGRFMEPYTFGRRLAKYIRTQNTNYDIIHDNQSLAWGLLDIERMGIPVIATIHHPITRDLAFMLESQQSKSAKTFTKRWHSFLDMQKDVAKKLSSIITVSENTKRDLTTDFDLLPEQMNVIHNGVDTELFKPQPHITRQEMSLITTASADVPLKGLTYLLKAFELLKPQYPALRLVVIGRPKESTNTILHRLGIADDVTFLYQISDQELVEVYARATIAVCPSLYEGFGFPAAEAMSCGVPLVSTNGGALPEVVGDAGLTVPPGDSDELATAISNLLDNAHLRQELGEKGRQRMLSNFTWQKAAHAYHAAYEKAIAHAHR
jgi:glycosyltransferase involved in cell wall biosynthesis